MIWKSYSFSLYLLFAISVNAQQKHTGVTRFLQADILEHTQISLFAKEVVGEKVIEAYQQQSGLIPASNVKLFTTAMAWDIIGPDYRLKTKFYLDGEPGPNQSWEGNLWIEGEGDPTLASKKWANRDIYNSFRIAASHLKSMGIDTISGDLIISNYPFEGEWHNSDWPWADIGNYYGISSGVVNFNENSYELTFNTTGAIGSIASVAAISPQVDLNIDNQVTIGPPNSGDQAYIYGDAHDRNRIVRGSVPKDGVSFSIKGSLPDPEMHFGAELQKSLLLEGIFIKGNIEIVSGPVPDKTLLIHTIESPPLSEIVNFVNRNSHNLFAEAIYKNCKYVFVDKYTSQLQLWKIAGIDEDKFRWKDGCGLSPFNRFSAKDFVELLVMMSDKDDYISTLAVPGEEGTLKYRFPNWKGNLKAKTGSIEGVYALSGFLELEGKTIAFSILVNNYHGSSRLLDHEVQKLFESWKE